MLHRLALACSLALVLPPVSARADSIDRADMDTTCSPCRDFNRHANGAWADRTTIPPSESTVGSFSLLAEANREFLRGMLERVVKAGGSGTASEQLLARHWSSCMDSAAAERAGLTPLEPSLAGIAAVRSPRELASRLGWLHAHSTPVAFAAFPAPDARNSELTIWNLGQGGLGLPDRDFYTRTDSGSVALRAAYRTHVERMLALAGSRDAALEADRVLSLETALANASMTNVERRNPTATYHKVPLDTLRAWTEGFDWDAYAAARPMRLPDSVNVSQPRFLRALAGLVAAVPIADWQAYLRWQVLSQGAPMLSSPFVELDFSFQKRLSGQTELQPRWKRCLRMTDQDLGDALGREFVEARFPPAAKAKAQKLVDDVEAALGERLSQLDWMGATTRSAAREKLDAIRDFIGYPERWRDYQGLTLSEGDFVANRIAAQSWEARRQMARIGGPVDKSEWRMSAPTVNAFYSGSVNSINFPAGILQPPFFSPDWDDASNYGAIGAVIGHEITHGFDDRGRQFDAKGNLRDWWKKEDAERYQARAQRVVEQFDRFTVAPGVHVNGKLTLGENIADLGGLAIAYAALQRAQGGKPGEVIDGWTAEQRFFLAYARVWRRLTRTEALINLVRTNPHAPGEFRVNGPLANLEEFQNAFGCRSGDPMVNPEERRARIW